MKARIKATGELWKNIPGYEDLYMVSNTGYVKSKERKVWNGNCYYLKAGRVLRPSICKNGYRYVILSSNGKKKTFAIHRLVALSFIPNTNNDPCINHKDENKVNNNVENLEWCTVEYNNRYGTKRDRISKTQIKCSLRKKKVIGFFKDGSMIHFESMGDASRCTKIRTSHISECCKGIRKTAGNAKWKYADELIKQLKGE